MARISRLGAESAMGREPWPGWPLAVSCNQNGAFSATSIPTNFTLPSASRLSPPSVNRYRVLEKICLVGDHPDRPLVFYLFVSSGKKDHVARQRRSLASRMIIALTAIVLRSSYQARHDRRSSRRQCPLRRDQRATQNGSAVTTSIWFTG